MLLSPFFKGDGQEGDLTFVADCHLCYSGCLGNSPLCEFSGGHASRHDLVTLSLRSPVWTGPAHFSFVGQWCAPIPGAFSSQRKANWELLIPASWGLEMACAYPCWNVSVCGAIIYIYPCAPELCWEVSHLLHLLSPPGCLPVLGINGPQNPRECGYTFSFPFL